MKRITVLLILALVAVGAFAQDWQLAPSFGDVELEAGFLPDPYRVDILAGGSIDISRLGYYGYVANAPDFDVYYSAGGFDLTIKVEDADGDTVLLVNAPDGQWHFNDDSNGLDPAITFRNPDDGLYDIWVGTFSSGGYVDATLVITEMD
jgi:hypothetical protein